MGYHILTKEGNSYNVPKCEFWCDSTAEVANLPTNVPAGSICICQIKSSTTSTLKTYMFHKSADNTGEWLEVVSE